MQTSHTRISKRFFWRLVWGNIVFLAVVLGLGMILILREVDAVRRGDLVDSLRAQARLLRIEAGSAFRTGDVEALASLARRAGGLGRQSARITLIAADGAVVGDSSADVARMDNHSNRPEVRQALRDGWGYAERRSRTLGVNLNYVAVRVGDRDAPRGVVRVALASDQIGQHLETGLGTFWRIGLIVFCAAALAALGLAMIWSRPVRRFIRITEHAADRNRHRPAAEDLTFDQLAADFVSMRNDLTAQFKTVERQKRILDTLLEKLREGVVVADGTGRIVLMNPAGRDMLGLSAPPGGPPVQVDGLPIEACIPTAPLQDMLRVPPKQSRARKEAPTEVPPDEPRTQAPHAEPGLPGPDAADARDAFLQQRVTVPATGGGRRVLARASNITLPPSAASTSAARRGRLLVLTDMTRIDRLMKARTDFVANASHELRTPLTAIRSALDTIRALDPARPDDRAAFEYCLDVLDRHHTRLAALVSDLLDLAKVESPLSRFSIEDLPTADLVARVRDRFQDTASTDMIQLVTDIAADVPTIRANTTLIRLVLDNLIDNATRFTPPGGTVTVSIRRRGDRTVLTVSDTGCGIPAHEQARVFERFYQVETSRSETATDRARGTGLGLSIVRHAVDAMNGTVHLTSRLHHGTTVTVELPAGA